MKGGEFVRIPLFHLFSQINNWNGCQPVSLPQMKFLLTTQEQILIVIQYCAVPDSHWCCCLRATSATVGFSEHSKRQKDQNHTPLKCHLRKEYKFRTCNSISHLHGSSFWMQRWAFVCRFGPCGSSPTSAYIQNFSFRKL